MSTRARPGISPETNYKHSRTNVFSSAWIWIIGVHIGLGVFERINWLLINDRFERCISSTTFNFFNNKNPAYMNDVFKPISNLNANTRISFSKLSQPLRKTTTVFIIIIIIIIIIFRFIAFAQAVLNAEIFLLGELQLVAKGQEDAFNLHV